MSAVYRLAAPLRGLVTCIALVLLFAAVALDDIFGSDIEREHPWALALYGAVVLAAIAASALYPWGVAP